MVELHDLHLPLLLLLQVLLLSYLLLLLLLLLLHYSDRHGATCSHDVLCSWDCVVALGLAERLPLALGPMPTASRQAASRAAVCMVFNWLGIDIHITGVHLMNTMGG